MNKEDLNKWMLRTSNAVIAISNSVNNLTMAIIEIKNHMVVQDKLIQQLIEGGPEMPEENDDVKDVLVQQLKTTIQEEFKLGDTAKLTKVLETLPVDTLRSYVR